MAMSKLEKIAKYDEEIEQIKKRQKELMQQYNAQERKARNHRLCKRGGLVEKLLPDLAVLSDEQFETFVEKTLLTPHTTRILAGLVPAIPEPVAESDTVVTPEVGTNGDENISTSAGVAS